MLVNLLYLINTLTIYLVDKHDAIVKLKDLAISLGRTPRRKEFESQVPRGRELIDLFGGFTQMCQAAGLEPSRIKITDAIFNRDIERHLDEQINPTPVQSAPWPKIAILGDMHEPFSHDGVKQNFKLFCQSFKPDYIVQIGDSVDFYAHSSFPKSHNIFSPKDEEALARKRLEEFWSEMALAAPKAKRIGLLGNHCVRPLKRVLESIPSIEHWAEKYLREFFSFSGVEMVMDPREEYIISDITFIHGFKSKLGDHRNHLMRNVVVGHSHAGGAVFRSFGDTKAGSTRFELNVGFCADPYSKGLTYTQTKTTGWTLGFGSIDQLGPRFIPYR